MIKDTPQKEKLEKEPQKTSNPDLSIIIPVFNEQENIKELYTELIEVISKLGTYEIIFINDSSTDNTLSELKQLKNIKIINLNKNYGQSIALDACFKLCKGKIIITLDGDLQNDPRDIPRLLEKLETNRPLKIQIKIPNKTYNHTCS